MKPAPQRRNRQSQSCQGHDSSVVSDMLFFDLDCASCSWMDARHQHVQKAVPIFERTLV